MIWLISFPMEVIMDFKLTDNSEEVKSAMEKAIARGLEEIGLTAEAYTKLKCPVDTGRLCLS